MLELKSGWQAQVDHSPEWMFVRFESVGDQNVEPSLAESIWAEASLRQITRFVVELGEGVWMSSYLVGQIMALHKRAHLQGGTLRICGISDDNHRVLRLMGLGVKFPNYPTRESAVMGHRPIKPR